jgi:signal transduction histidine kinase
MRRRLTIAILVLVAATLVVTAVGGFYLIRRAAVTTGQTELSKQARAISSEFSNNTNITKTSFRRQLTIISDAGAYAGIVVVKLYPDGSITGTLPSNLSPDQIDVPGLRAGRQISGHTPSLVIYSAIATPITGVNGFLPILVISRQLHSPFNGIRYFALVGAIALLVAALVAAGLARRFTRPLVAAVTTTRRMASGDLDATVPVEPRQDPEFAQLAESINSMGANLVRARDQERQFILSVSHELRTPLTSIRGYADAIIDGATDDPTAAATVISGEARRLERLVQDLLDLARLDANRFSLDVQTVDCAQIVRQVADGFRPRATELGLELVTSHQSDQPLWVDADADRLGQVLANLVENASTFAEHRIAIGAGSIGETPAVWVVDDGPGIPADQMSKVFQRHFTSDRGSGRHSGSGLGLAIVAELAAAMGAAVRAESPVAEGVGTRMVIWFPTHAHGSSPEPPPVPPETSSTADASTWPGKTAASDVDEANDG